MKLNAFFPTGSTIIILFFSLFITGCAHMAKQARVSLADIQILEIRPLETAFLVELRVMNTNDSPMFIQGIECDLEVDGNHFASGVAGDQHEIPAYGSAIIPVTVYASVLDVVPSVIRIVQGRNAQDNQKPLHYELAGHIRLGDNNAHKKSLPFQSNGELSFGGIR